MSLHENIVGTQGEEAEWYNLVGQFRIKAQAFENDYRALLSQSPTIAPEMRAEYDRLVSRGATIRKTILTATAAIDRATSFIDSIFSSVGLSGHLGLIPLLPVALIIAAVAAMSKFGLDYLTFQKKLAEVRRLQDGGLSHKQAVDQVNKLAGEGQIIGILKSLTPFLILGGLYLFSKRK